MNIVLVEPYYQNADVHNNVCRQLIGNIMIHYFYRKKY
jgi:hypothetical protein